MRPLKQSTARTVTIGPLFDWSDSKTLLSDALGGNDGLTIADLTCTLTKNSTQSALTLTKTGGSNDFVLVSGGMATLELTASNTDTQGELIISLTNTTEGGEVIFPVTFVFTVIFESSYATLVESGIVGLENKIDSLITGQQTVKNVFTVEENPETRARIFI